MSILDGILKNIGGAPDDVVNLAAKIGIDPAMAEQAIAALGKTHQLDGDTVTLAAEKTGLSPDILNQIVDAIGGEGSLSNFASILDRDGDGNPVDDIMDMAKGLLGGKS
jgi:threonine dehydrogenase-like Zn-dependent dehydrogenase